MKLNNFLYLSIELKIWRCLHALQPVKCQWWCNVIIAMIYSFFSCILGDRWYLKTEQIETETFFFLRKQRGKCSVKVNKSGYFKQVKYLYFFRFCVSRLNKILLSISQYSCKKSTILRNYYHCVTNQIFKHFLIKKTWISHT